MNFLTNDSTIIACSSGGKTNAAIALIRLSGFESLNEFQKFFSIDLSEVKPRYVYYCNLINEDKVIDSIVLTYFKGPNSFNGENILELSVHGNVINIDRIINLFVDAGLAQVAMPGEFSYRALKNKKMTMSQVEGLDTLLNATSTFMLDNANNMLLGTLQKLYQDLYDKFLLVKSSVELSIDFLDDVGEEAANENFQKNLSNFVRSLSEVYHRTRGPLESILSPKILLFGQPNAGKSSFFNALTNSNRAIVSDIAGTTRDYITETIYFDGVHFQLVDTAGMRVASDVIESEGVRRAKELMSSAFYKILLINPFETKSEELDDVLGDQDFDHIIVTHLDKKDALEKYNALIGERDIKVPQLHVAIIDGRVEDAILIDNGGPIEPAETNGPIEPDKKDGPIEPVKNGGPIEPVKKNGPIEPELKKIGPIEPVKKDGPIEPVEKNGPIEPVEKDGPIEPVEKSGPIEPLGKVNNYKYLEGLIAFKYKEIANNNEIIVPRHRQVISDIYDQTLRFQAISESNEDIAIVSSELNLVGVMLEELIGYISPDDVLTNIFSNFCIGK